MSPPAWDDCDSENSDPARNCANLAWDDCDSKNSDPARHWTTPDKRISRSEWSEASEDGGWPPVKPQPSNSWGAREGPTAGEVRCTPDLCRGYGTALGRAARQNDLRAMEDLLDRGDDPDERSGDDSLSPVQTCARYNHVKAMKLLLRYGAVVLNASWKYGQSPYEIAASCGHAQILRALISDDQEYLAQLQPGDHPPRRPDLSLSLALHTGHEETILILLDLAISYPDFELFPRDFLCELLKSVAGGKVRHSTEMKAKISHRLCSLPGSVTRSMVREDWQRRSLLELFIDITDTAEDVIFYATVIVHIWPEQFADLDLRNLTTAVLRHGKSLRIAKILLGSGVKINLEALATVFMNPNWTESKLEEIVKFPERLDLEDQWCQDWSGNSIFHVLTARTVDNPFRKWTDSIWDYFLLHVEVDINAINRVGKHVLDLIVPGTHNGCCDTGLSSHSIRATLIDHGARLPRNQDRMFLWSSSPEYRGPAVRRKDAGLDVDKWGVKPAPSEEPATIYKAAEPVARCQEDEETKDFDPAVTADDRHESRVVLDEADDYRESCETLEWTADDCRESCAAPEEMDDCHECCAALTETGMVCMGFCAGLEETDDHHESWAASGEMDISWPSLDETDEYEEVSAPGSDTVDITYKW